MGICMNKKKLTVCIVLVLLYVFGIVLLPALYFMASRYTAECIYIFTFAFPLSLFINYIFLTDIIIAKITGKAKK